MLPPTEVIAFAEPCFCDCHCASDVTASSSYSSSEEPERLWELGISMSSGIRRLRVWRKRGRLSTC